MKTNKFAPVFVWLLPIACIWLIYLFYRYSMNVRTVDLLANLTRANTFAILPTIAWVAGHNLYVRFPLKIFLILCQGFGVAICYYLLFRTQFHIWQTLLILLGWSLLWSFLGAVQIKPKNSVLSWIYKQCTFWYPLLIVCITGLTYWISNNWCADTIGGAIGPLIVIFITYPFLCFIYGATIWERKFRFVFYHGLFTQVSLIFIVIIMILKQPNLLFIGGLIWDTIIASLLLGSWCILWTFLGKRTFQKKKLMQK